MMYEGKSHTLFTNEAVWVCHSASELLTAMTAILLLALIHRKSRKHHEDNLKEERL